MALFGSKQNKLFGHPLNWQLKFTVRKNWTPYGDLQEQNHDSLWLFRPFERLSQDFSKYKESFRIELRKRQTFKSTLNILSNQIDWVCVFIFSTNFPKTINNTRRNMTPSGIRIVPSNIDVEILLSLELFYPKLFFLLVEFSLRIRLPKSSICVIQCLRVRVRSIDPERIQIVSSKHLALPRKKTKNSVVGCLMGRTGQLITVFVHW